MIYRPSCHLTNFDLSLFNYDIQFTIEEMFNKTRASVTATLEEDSEDPVTNERPGAGALG